MKDLLKDIWHDKSLVRFFLNRRLEKECLQGEILDVGCGSNPAYLDFVPRTQSAQMHVFDPKVGKVIDFEKDAFPHQSETFDTVLVLNVLEHVFHYNHLVSEMKRVMKQGGVLIGFTPFLVRYHPDPHDFFRYTNEALLHILSAQGFRNVHIEPIGHGPFLASCNIFFISVPRPVRMVCAFCAGALDWLFLKLRPQARNIYPMGYYFTATK